MQKHLAAHALKADAHNLRRARLALFAVDDRSLDFAQTVGHIVFELNELLYLFRMVRVHLLCCSAKACHARNILSAGTHACLLAASVDERFDLHAITDV